jgi:hypothetical protein
MTGPEPTSTTWRKSSRSGTENNINCLEAAGVDGVCAVRDSKSPGRGVLTFAGSAWRAFLTDSKRGRYDL